MLRSRRDGGDGSHNLAVELVTPSSLKHLTGASTDDGAIVGSFPQSGSIYVLKDSPSDVEIEETLATVRECFLPHTYRLRAKYSSASGTIEGKRLIDSPQWSMMLRWLCAYGSSLEAITPEQTMVDLASLFADAEQTRDMLLQRSAMCITDKDFRSGFESTEHMALKNALLRGHRRRNPDDQIAVEQLIPQRNEDDNDEESESLERKDKPDILVEGSYWIEVETLRGLSLRGSNPFLALESKLRPKVPGMQRASEVCLVVPSDLAMIATEQLSSVTRSLNSMLGGSKIKLAFVDLITEVPIFIPQSPESKMQSPRLRGASWRSGKQKTAKTLKWSDIAGYSDLKSLLHADLLDPLLDSKKYEEHGTTAANGLLLYGLPGCGKSLIGRVLAGEADLSCRLLMPSDLTSMWLGEGVEKVRALFDWAIKQAPSLIVLDEIDAVAPQRSAHNMHSDERRQVNELLAQLDRIADKGVVVVATTNYVRGIDTAIMRSGRFDLKLPVFPPNSADRAAIFEYYLKPPQAIGFRNTDEIDTATLAEASALFTPADIRTVVERAKRRSIQVSPDNPAIDPEMLLDGIRNHPRSIRKEMAIEWLNETSADLGDDLRLSWLRREIESAFACDD